MEAALRAGAAVYNAGHYHAAHDAWEERWLALESGTDDERLLHGLIQFTAAVYHAHEGNWSGTRGLADSAGGYLADLPAAYRGVDLDPVRAYLRRVAADPETVERRRAPPLRVGGVAPQLADLGFDAAAVAAVVLAGEREAFDAETVQRAVAYARSDDGGRFRALVADFAGDAERRGLVYRRLADHVDRRRRRDADVDGLFD